jgi:hypothetical protein
MDHYTNLIASDPFVYIEFTNSLGQRIKIVEDPIWGDEAPVIAVCDDLKIADFSDFYETGEVDEVGGEYEVGFVDGVLVHGLQ